MTDFQLILGNRNFSSWSMRAWLAARQTGAAFEERTIWFDEDPDREERRRHAPTGRVPVLVAPEVTVWDSLAIAEYLAERYPDRGLWPEDAAARARARSLCCEMHAGFPHVRSELPLNCRARREARDRGPEVAGEVARVQEMWRETRAAFGAGGPFLFGAWSLADAFYAPVASRLRTYAVELEGEARDYARALLDAPDVAAWHAAAEEERHDSELYGHVL